MSRPNDPLSKPASSGAATARNLICRAGVQTLDKKAAASSNKVTSPPSNSVGCRASAFMSAASAWVEPGVGQIDQKVDEDHQRREEQHHVLDHHEIPLAHGLEQQAPQTGQREKRSPPGWRLPRERKTACP